MTLSLVRFVIGGSSVTYDAAEFRLARLVLRGRSGVCGGCGRTDAFTARYARGSLANELRRVEGFILQCSCGHTYQGVLR